MTDAILLGSPRDDAGNLIMLGTGRQRWATVHVADLADAFRRALEDDSARGHYVVGDGLNPKRPGPRLISIGPRHIQDSSTSSATAVTATER